MKHLKIFEDYKTSEEIEDILLPYIDDGDCSIMVNREHYRTFYFKSNFIRADAILRILNNKVSNAFSDDDNIYWYSKELENYIVGHLTQQVRTSKDWRNQKILINYNFIVEICSEFYIKLQSANKLLNHIFWLEFPHMRNYKISIVDN